MLFFSVDSVFFNSLLTEVFRCVRVCARASGSVYGSWGGGGVKEDFGVGQKVVWVGHELQELKLVLIEAGDMDWGCGAGTGR